MPEEPDEEVPDPEQGKDEGTNAVGVHAPGGGHGGMVLNRVGFGTGKAQGRKKALA